MKQQNIIITVLALTFLSGLNACEPKPDSAELLDEFVVVTNKDKDVKFGEYKTYTIQLDTIALYSNVPGSAKYLTNADPDLGGYPSKVINKVISNMNTRGYTLVDKDKNPDLGINVFIIYNYSQYQSVVYTGGYGSGYYGYGGYGYGGYSPYYVQTTESNRGSLNFEMVDLKNIVGNNVKVIWYSTMGDLFNAIDPIQQSIDAVDQSFKQSPYVQN